MDERIERLVTLAELHHATVVLLTQHIGLLAQSVVLLLGEEAGTPIADPDSEAATKRTDLDGVEY
jgi:hypothetical protein